MGAFCGCRPLNSRRNARDNSHWWARNQTDEIHVGLAVTDEKPQIALDPFWIKEDIGAGVEND